MRLGIKKLNRESFKQLILAEKAPKDKRLKGDASYRILRHTIAEQFNYSQPGLKNCRQTDFVISQSKSKEFKRCSLDVVSAVAYLAYLKPEVARDIKFSTEYLFINYQNKLDLKEKQLQSEKSNEISEEHPDSKLLITRIN